MKSMVTGLNQDSSKRSAMDNSGISEALEIGMMVVLKDTRSSHGHRNTIQIVYSLYFKNYSGDSQARVLC